MHETKICTKYKLYLLFLLNIIIINVLNANQKFEYGTKEYYLEEFNKWDTKLQDYITKINKKHGLISGELDIYLDENYFLKIKNNSKIDSFPIIFLYAESNNNYTNSQENVIVTNFIFKSTSYKYKTSDYGIYSKLEPIPMKYHKKSDYPYIDPFYFDIISSLNNSISQIKLYGNQLRKLQTSYDYFISQVFNANKYIKPNESLNDIIITYLIYYDAHYDKWSVPQ